MKNHPNMPIREGLKYAEVHGRAIKKSSPRAHAWGVIYWSFGHRACWMAIYSTPKNPVRHAQNITDASIRGHADGMELLFERCADSLQAAISSAISDVERAGYRVTKVEMDREAIPV